MRHKISSRSSELSSQDDQAIRPPDSRTKSAAMPVHERFRISNPPTLIRQPDSQSSEVKVEQVLVSHRDVPSQQLQSPLVSHAIRSVAAIPELSKVDSPPAAVVRREWRQDRASAARHAS